MDAEKIESKKLLSINRLLFFSLEWLKCIFAFGLSFLIVGLGQPARVPFLGVLSAGCGYALFFSCLQPHWKAFRRFFTSTLWFFCVQLIQLSWMTSIEFQGYYILFVYAVLCLLFAAQFGFLSLLVPREGTLSLSRILLVASVWTLMEWIRLFPLCGFTWNPVGMALSSAILSMQFASVFGVFGLTFWVVLSNLVCLNWGRSLRVWRKAALFFAVAGFPYIFGVIHLNQKTSVGDIPSVSAALVQTEMLPSQKIPYSDRAQDFIPALDQWKNIILALKNKEGDAWDLIVMPEGAVRYQADLCAYLLKDALLFLTGVYGHEIYLSLPPLRAPYAERRYLEGGWQWCISNLFWSQTLSNIYHSELVIGLDYLDSSTDCNYNSAFHFLPNQTRFNRYDKRVLLPLAEYLPFESVRSLAKRYGISHFFSRGQQAVLFEGKIPLCPSICYEETFPERMRKAKQRGGAIFVNLTNDNYFPNSKLHQQHFTMRA